MMSAPDRRVGELLDCRHRLLRRLGSGGAGAVYLARQEEMDRLVEVKLLHSDLFPNPSAFARFRREARAAGSLRHPHVVLIHDFGRTESGEPYLVMEYCDGGSLADRLAGGTVQALLVAHLTQQPPLLGRAIAGAPEEVEAVFLTALDKQPAVRFESVGAFIAALGAALAGSEGLEPVQRSARPRPERATAGTRERNTLALAPIGRQGELAELETLAEEVAAVRKMLGRGTNGQV